MSRPDLTCREFVEFVMDYLALELAPDAHADFEAHLAECPNCVRYLETYRATVVLGRAAFDDLDAELPAEVPEELIQAILEAGKKASGLGEG
jgi:anti-sigma factor RsiW